jgi:hypothetical protein
MSEGIRGGRLVGLRWRLVCVLTRCAGERLRSIRVRVHAGLRAGAALVEPLRRIPRRRLAVVVAVGRRAPHRIEPRRLVSRGPLALIGAACLLLLLLVLQILGGGHLLPPRH